MIWSTEEIVRSYRMAADPKKQIKVLAELNACSVKEIRPPLRSGYMQRNMRFL